MKLFIFLFSIIFTSLLSAQGDNAELMWPRKFDHGSASFSLYQPQLDSYKDNILEGRMAVSIHFPEKEIIFGAIWFRAQMSVDKTTRMVSLEDMVISRSKFAEFNEGNTNLVESIIIDELKSAHIVMSLDVFMASLGAINENKEFSTQLNNTPPIIYYRSHPAVLIYIDGEPILKDTDEMGWQYVVNTPYFIAFNQSTKQYFLKGGNEWFQSRNIKKGWQPTTQIPDAALKLEKEAFTQDEEQDYIKYNSNKAPEIIVSTEPAELITTNGSPDYATLKGTSLLYVKNTEADIIMNIQTQQHYILISGRWYTSRQLNNGDWQFIEPSDLPSDFSKIDKESELGNVLHSVPGTEEANMALLEQSIPETATVDRKTATVKVTFDGEPKFQKVEGTSVAYALNADKTILLINGLFYCVDDAIWFVSSKPDGSYTVSVKRPDEVDQLPPSSPVYNVKYVYVYDYTPDVVYVGYTPGYMNAYPYDGVVVYGTGYYYHPWYGSYYYPRPVTYGFGVHYNAWTGWGFSFGLNYGWFSMGWHSYPYWWGCQGYHPGYRHGCYPGYRARHRPSGYVAPRRPRTEHYNAYANRASRPGTSRDVRPTQLPSTGRSTRQGTRSSRPVTSSVGNSSQRLARPTNSLVSRPSIRPARSINNVYTDRNGNIYRKSNTGNWQNRSRNNWQNNSKSINNRINRDSRSRQSGNQHYQNYNRSRPANPSRTVSPSRTPPPTTSPKGRSGR